MFANRRTSLRNGLIALAATVGCVVTVATAVVHAGRPAMSKMEPASWAEEAWPFPIDQWGMGRAFRCSTGACGTDLHLYLRAKAGFCRCATGVSDDDEIDRGGVTELFGRDYAPLAPGHAVVAGLLKGRARPFTVDRALQPSLPVLTIALANSCDAVVATAAAGSELTAAQEGAALDFLRTEMVQRWAVANTQSQ
jgi:hypothetical protein